MEAESGPDAERGLGARDLAGPAAASLAVALFLWASSRPGGASGAPFGELAALFWTGAALWLAASLLAVRARQHWWVIATAPFPLYPISMAALLAAACFGGDCL